MFRFVTLSDACYLSLHQQNKTTGFKLYSKLIEKIRKNNLDLSIKKFNWNYRETLVFQIRNHQNVKEIKLQLLAKYP